MILSFSRRCQSYYKDVFIVDDCKVDDYQGRMQDFFVVLRFSAASVANDLYRWGSGGRCKPHSGGVRGQNPQRNFLRLFKTLHLPKKLLIYNLKKY